MVTEAKVWTPNGWTKILEKEARQINFAFSMLLLYFIFVFVHLEFSRAYVCQESSPIGAFSSHKSWMKW